MSALYRQEGAMMEVEILKDEKVLDFIDTHASVLDSTFEKVKMSDGMRSSLQQSNWVFSGMKTFHELKEAFPSLIDENGEKKPFERFYNDVQRVDETYNRNYLRAEYNFVSTSAEMAARWEEFEKDGDRYFLQYRTVGDDRVRKEHAALDATTLPVEHPFWDTHYPPNGWNCRCNVVQVRKSRYPATSEDELIERKKALAEEQARHKGKSEMFRFNPGKQKKTLPDYNPYTIKRCGDCDLAKGKMSMAILPDNEVCMGCRLIRSINRSQNKAEFNRLKNNPNYKDVAYDEKSGGVKAVHNQHNFDDKKGWYELRAQNAGFLHGHSVILEREDHTKQGKKNTEGRWDGELFEIAGAENATENNIIRALKHCAKKDADIAVVYFPNDNFNAQTFEQAYIRFLGLKKRNDGQYRRFKLIYCIHEDRMMHIKKPS